jgi:hypothetical protein
MNSPDPFVIIDSIEFIGCSSTPSFVSVFDGYPFSDTIPRFEPRYGSNDINYDIFQLGKDKYGIWLPKEQWKLNNKEEEDLTIFCPFCNHELFVNMVPAFRMPNSPLKPVLYDCGCVGRREYLKKLSGKTLRLEHENYKHCNTNGEKLCVAVYENTIFVWSNANVHALIIQSEKFRNYVISDEVGYVQNNLLISERLKTIVEYLSPKLTHDPNITVGKEILEIPYNVDLDRDIDKLIEQSKQDAKNEMCFFYFPPPDVDSVIPITDAQYIENTDLPFINSNCKFDRNGQILLRRDTLFDDFCGLLPMNLDLRVDRQPAITESANFSLSTLDKVIANNLLKLCSVGTICALHITNKWWREVCRNDLLWQYLLKRDFNNVSILQFGGYREQYKKLYIQKHNVREKDVSPCSQSDTTFAQVLFSSNLLSQHFPVINHQFNKDRKGFRGDGGGRGGGDGGGGDGGYIDFY